MESDRLQIPPNVHLDVIKGIDEDKIFTINNKTMTIGRENVCDIKLTDEYVSKKHCQIVYRNDHFTAIDLGSLNKTKVNDRIYVQKNLKNNDTITLGKTQLQFRWEEQDIKTIDESEDILGDETDTGEKLLDCDD